LCLAVAGGVAYVAVQLQSTSAALVRDAESLRLITQVELQLLDFQRLSTFTDDSQAQIQLQALREDLQATLAQALLHAADPAEADSIEQTAADIQAYMNSRDALIASGADPLSIPRLARPALSVALQGLEVLSDMNRNEVTRAY